MKHFNYFFSIFIFVICLFLNACAQKTSEKKMGILTIKEISESETYLFASQFLPINQTPIFAPIDGNLLAQPISYGSPITKGKPIFIISSTTLLSDLEKKIMQYIKIKTEYEHDLRLYREAIFLHQHQLIADNDLAEKTESLSLSAMDLQEATLSLMQLASLLHLTIHDSQTPDTWFHMLHTLPRTFSIIANTNGIFLPHQYQGELKQWEMGDSIKTNDVLGYIGNITGYRLIFEVGEEMVNTLHEKDKVSITGPAFQEKLIGEIYSIEKVGKGSNDKPPTFTITVTVPPQPLLAKANIHIGMSAIIMLSIKKPKAIYIPISALHEINQHYYVILITAENNQKKVLVTPGETTPTSVMILHGLKMGDRMITHD